MKEKIVCWFDCCWSPAVVTLDDDLLLFPFMSLAKLNFDMFTYLLLLPATNKSRPLWNDGDLGMFTLNFCSSSDGSASSLSGDNCADNFILALLDTKTILFHQTTSMPIQNKRIILVSISFRLFLTLKNDVDDDFRNVFIYFFEGFSNFCLKMYSNDFHKHTPTNSRYAKIFFSLTCSSIARY